MRSFKHYEDVIKESNSFSDFYTPCQGSEIENTTRWIKIINQHKPWQILYLRIPLFDNLRLLSHTTFCKSLAIMTWIWYALLIFRCPSTTSNDYVRKLIRDKFIDLHTIIIYHMMFFIVFWFKNIPLHFFISLHVPLVPV